MIWRWKLRDTWSVKTLFGPLLWTGALQCERFYKGLGLWLSERTLAQNAWGPGLNQLQICRLKSKCFRVIYLYNFLCSSEDIVEVRVSGHDMAAVLKNSQSRAYLPKTCTTSLPPSPLHHRLQGCVCVSWAIGNEWFLGKGESFV